MESAKKGDLSRTLICAAAAVALLISAGAQAAGVSGQGTWETTLQPRDIDGDSVTDAFYDSVLDVTWLRSVNSNSSMNWDQAKVWADTMVVGAVSDWRLPTMIDTGSLGCDFSVAGGTDCGFNSQTRSAGVTYSEMAHLFYVTLGNKRDCAAVGDPCIQEPPGPRLTNTGGFQNLVDGVYWTGLAVDEQAPLLNGIHPIHLAWAFYTTGMQVPDFKTRFQTTGALAIRSGDVTAIPEPKTYALLLVGLAVLGFARRRRSD